MALAVASVLAFVALFLALDVAGWRDRLLRRTAPGTVPLSGNRVRITANLLHAPTDRHLWAETHQRDLQDVLSLQDEVAESVARAIKAALSPAESRRRPRCWAPAYAGLATSYGWLWIVGGVSAQEALPRFEAALKTALAMDDTDPQARCALAASAFYDRWGWGEGEREFQRVLALDPGLVEARFEYAWFLSAMGRFPAAVAEAQPVERDPLSVSASFALGDIYIFRAPGRPGRLTGQENHRTRPVVAGHERCGEEGQDTPPGCRCISGAIEMITMQFRNVLLFRR